MITLTIKGSIPSKKNSKQWIWSRTQQRKLLVPSDNFNDWHEEWSYKLARSVPKRPFLRCKITFRYFARDTRNRDLDNQNTSILDLLKDLSFIKDDNWFVVKEVNSKLVKVDPKNPRCEIKIVEI